VGGKLFHIDLNAQRIGRYDQDFRFGAGGPEGELPARAPARARRLLGPLHFDAHSYRNENAEGVWDFAAGCMSTYRALAERARHFDSLPEVQEALEAASTPELALASVDGDEAETLKAEAWSSTRSPGAAITTSDWTNCWLTYSSASAEVDIDDRPAV
jgi:xylose isomerase